jgi:hypothetical protein
LEEKGEYAKAVELITDGRNRRSAERQPARVTWW